MLHRSSRAVHGPAGSLLWLPHEPHEPHEPHTVLFIVEVGAVYLDRLSPERRRLTLASLGSGAPCSAR